MEFEDRVVRTGGDGKRAAGPGRWRRLVSFLRDWECQGWHAACPTIRSERRRSSASSPPPDRPIRTDSHQIG